MANSIGKVCMGIFYIMTSLCYSKETDMSVFNADIMGIIKNGFGSEDLCVKKEASRFIGDYANSVADCSIPQSDTLTLYECTTNFLLDNDIPQDQKNFAICSMGDLTL